jgi:hypothetical protein
MISLHDLVASGCVELDVFVEEGLIPELEEDLGPFEDCGVGFGFEVGFEVDFGFGVGFETSLGAGLGAGFDFGFFALGSNVSCSKRVSGR